MSGFVLLALLATLLVYGLRLVCRRLRLPAPTASAIVIVFLLVVLALYGRHLNQ